MAENSRRIMAMAAAWLLVAAGSGEVAAACSANNNDYRCASFIVIDNEEQIIVDVRQRRQSAVSYLYRVCASHGSFSVTTAKAEIALGPGDCVDFDVVGGQSVSVKGRSDVASGEYLLLNASK